MKNIKLTKQVEGYVKKLNGITWQKLFIWIVIIMIWELGLRIGWLDSRFLPSFKEILLTGASVIFSRAFIYGVAYTLLFYFIGLAVGCVIGYCVGIFVILNKRAKNYVMLLVDFLRPLPSVALIPIVILLLGLGMRMRVFIISYGVVWPILISTIYGAENISNELQEMVKNLYIPKKQFVFQVIFPASLPFIISGVRTASGIALLLSLSIEIIAGGNGLGNYIVEMQYASNFAGIYFVILFIGFLGFSLNKLFESLETWYWQSFTLRNGFRV